MPELNPQAKQDLDRAFAAYQMAGEALAAFQRACQAGNEDLAEELRENALSLMGSFMDNYAVAFRI